MILLFQVEYFTIKTDISYHLSLNFAELKFCYKEKKKEWIRSS